MKKSKKSLVWAIQKADECKTSYILGTMHVRNNSAFKHQNLFFNTIDQCETFATEFNLDTAAHHFNQMAVLLPEQLTLKALFKEKWYERLNQLFKKRVGSSLSEFERFRPIFLVHFLTEAILSQDRSHSLDETLWKYAKTQQKALMGIETLEQQIEVLQKMSLEEQIKQLKDIVRNFDRFRKSLLRMTRLYEQADIEKLLAAAKKSIKGTRKLLLYDRNVLMTDRIDAIHAQSSLCAAIGAGHLAGKKGVLRLLKQKGFSIKPVLENGED